MSRGEHQVEPADIAMVDAASSPPQPSSGGAGNRSRSASPSVSPAKVANGTPLPCEPPMLPPCPDFVYYTCNHWSGAGRSGTKTKTLLLLPRNEYDYWHHRLNLYLCDTWGDVRRLGDGVYAEVKDRFMHINKDKGYVYDDNGDEEDFFHDDDEFNAWDDLHNPNADQEAMITYPYSIRKIMYEDTHHGAYVPADVRAYGHTPSADEEASEFYPEDLHAIIDIIAKLGGKATEERELQDFLIADSSTSVDWLLEETEFVLEYRKRKLSGPKYEAMVKKLQREERIKDQNRKEEERWQQQQQQEAQEEWLEEEPIDQLCDKLGDKEGNMEEEPIDQLCDKLVDKEGNMYDYAPLPKEGAKAIKAGDRVLCCFTSGWDIGRVADKKRYSKAQKKEARKMVSPILVHYESDGMYWLHDMGLEEAPYLPHDKFKRLTDGSSTDEQEGIKPGYWCLVVPK